MNRREFQRKLVAEAANYLDAERPGWWAKINPLSLDMRSSADCICGQNNLWWQTETARFIQTITPSQYACFAVSVFSDVELEPFWLEEIAQRVPTRKEEPCLV